MRGRAGAPCACFGARSTVGWPAVARNVVLAAAFAALPSLPERELSTDEWLGLGLVVALLACAGLAVAVLALAREVGLLRLRLGPGSALEIAEEGPELFADTGLGDRLVARPRDGARRSPSSRRPAVTSASRSSRRSRALANDPRVALATFDEADESDVWSRLAIPGSPFAIALDLDGSVLAKGTFNNLAQLESVLATGERRRAERDLMAGAPLSERVGRALDSLAGESSRRGFLARAGRRPHGRDGRRAGRQGGQARRCGRVSLLRAHLHHRAPACTRRACRASTATAIRLTPRPESPSTTSAAMSTTGPACRRSREGPARPRRPAVAAGAAHEGVRRDVARLRVRPARRRRAGTAAVAAPCASSCDCCAHTQKRINGDAALEGYCYRGRKVFCVMFFQTKIPC